MEVQSPEVTATGALLDMRPPFPPHFSLPASLALEVEVYKQIHKERGANEGLGGEGTQFFAYF